MMKAKSLVLTIIAVAAAMFGGAMFGGIMIHPASGFSNSTRPYAWTYSFTQLAPYPVQSSPSLLYNPHLNKIFFAYAPGDGCLPCGNLNIISSTDMTTWTNSVDTGDQAAFETIGLTYNPDDQRMYVVFPQIPDGNNPLSLTMQVISSSDGTSWSNMVNIHSFSDSTSTYYNNGPEILFDSTNHRLLVSYSTFESSCSCNHVYIFQSYAPFSQTWSFVSQNPVSVGGSAISVHSAPAVMFLNGQLYMTYVAADLSIHVAQSSDGITWTNKVDFPGESAYFATIAYNPVEQSFHLVYVGTSNPFYLYDNTSPDAISWRGVTELYQSSSTYAASLNAPSLAFIPTKNVLLLGYTGTDGSIGCPCHQGHLYTMPEIAPTDGASFISWTPPPTQMSPGQTANVAVTMKNPDYQCCSNYGIPAVWNPPSSDPNPFRLGSQNPQDNNNWGFNRVDLTDIVVQGQAHTFSFSITAPTTAGTYNFQWRMVQEGVRWFGDSTPNLQVSVGTPSTRLSNDPTSSDWTVQRTSWNLVSGYLDGSGTSAEIASRNSFASDRTVTVSAKSVTPGSQSWYMPWIRGKWVDDCNTATLVFLNGATLGLQLNVAQGCTNHQWTVTTSLSPTAWHSVKMVFTGNEVKVYVDGTLYFDQTDAFIGNLGAARVALASWGPSESQFDSMTIS
jgi:hypothetical protein